MPVAFVIDQLSYLCGAGVELRGAGAGVGAGALIRGIDPRDEADSPLGSRVRNDGAGRPTVVG